MVYSIKTFIIFIYFIFGQLITQYENLKPDDNFIAIDHIPVVVKDLDKLKKFFSEDLHFKIKAGKNHLGIENCFVKFEDGRYLEFISVTDPSLPMGKYYATYLKERQGGTAFAISIKHAETVIPVLNGIKKPFIVEKSKIWQTIEPENEDFFFIEYSDKSWKESAKYTDHENTAASISAVFYLTNSLKSEENKYNVLGVWAKKNGRIINTPYKILKIGQSDLCLLDGSKSGTIQQKLDSPNLNGICGFNIKLKSLKAFNKMITGKYEVSFEKKCTTVFLKEYHMFLRFSE